MNQNKPNRLISEQSPYLLQHAYNPVDWYPWCEEAFKEARKQNKPIFLSIGYSSCYWCHVMARESFENREIAELLNKFFINIKVDREERPEIDRIYMIALQSMLGYGGWPLNIFLNLDLKPFYGFTYLPPKAKYGRSGLEDVIIQVNNLWNAKRKELNESAEKIFVILKNKIEHQKVSSDSDSYYSIIQECFESAKRYYDYENGGFGNSNKFPRPSYLNFLLKYYYYFNDKEALDIVTHTLKAMYKGGIFDHIGGGFHRYSVDKFWRIPHFEKMLYDQAQLIITYLDAYKITNEELFFEIALKVFNYVKENLSSPRGGYYSSEDAESLNEEGVKEEGYYYFWKYNELEKILTEKEFRIFNYIFGIKYEGNTIPDYHERFKNNNILYINNDIYETAKYFNIPVKEVEEILKSAIEKLKFIRQKRNKPETDYKIITCWNGMMMTAILELYRVTLDKQYLDLAEKLAEFIFIKLYDKDQNILYHSFINETRTNEGNLEDYVYIIKSLINLYEATFKIDYLIDANNLLDRTIELFYDENSGGFWDTPNDKENLIFKTKDISDTAEPSGNAIMIELLLKMDILDDKKFYNKKAIKSLEHFTNTISDSPYSYPQMISSILLYLNGNIEIISTCDINSELFKEFQNKISKIFIPFFSFYQDTEELTEKYDIFKNYHKNKDSIFICKNFTCHKPISTIEDLKDFDLRKYNNKI